MRRPRLIGFALLALLPGLSFAEPQSDGERAPAVSFDTFPLPLKRTYVFSSAGTPTLKAKEMDSPFPDDFPPSTVIYFEDLRRYPSLEKGPVYMMTARNVLRVYNISALKSAPYQTIQDHIERLRRLLKRKPNVIRDDESHSLPDYPPRNAGHLLDVKLSYVANSWGSGMLYVTRFVQGVGEWPDNEQLVYLLQGLSKDNRFYLSADFRITHPALENAKPSTDKREDADQLTARLTSILAKDGDDAYTPSLKKIRDWVAALKIE